MRNEQKTKKEKESLEKERKITEKNIYERKHDLF